MITRRSILKLLGMSPAIPAVKSVEELQLKPGDAIVLKFEHHLTSSHAVAIREQFQNGWNGRFKDVPVIVLDAGADIQVLRSVADEKLPEYETHQAQELRKVLG